MPKYLNPKVDLTFKKIFGEHPNLVKSLLNALLPLPKDMTIEEVEIIDAENVPDNPTKKYSIVDVRCTDNRGRNFIVEMQNYWNREFFSRTLFNATSAYSKQLAKGNSFENLKDVYALALVNDKAFDYEGDDGYMQEFYLINKNHTEDIRHSLSLIFVELVKYKPKDRGSRAIKDLWLRFLTEIDESTKEVDKVMLDNPEISQALGILETSAYSDGDMYAYEDFLLDVVTHRNAMKNEREDGLAEGLEKGLKEGRAEGEKIGVEKGAKQKAYDIARNLKSIGLSAEQIATATGLSVEEIYNIR